MISFHLNTRDVEKHYKYSDSWKKIDDGGDPKIVARIVATAVASPIIWFNGERRSERYMYNDWIVLDFDKDVKLDYALKMFRDYTHVIGTTKRHLLLLDSDGKKIDRFRVWLRLAERCTSLSQYVYNTKKYAEMFGSDLQAIDGARKFLPSKVVSVQRANTLHLYANFEIEKKQYVCKGDKFIPRFIEDMLKNGVADGKRNYACYTIGKYLTRNGFCKDEIVDMIMSSNVPLGTASVSEVRKAVESALRRV